jgi:hypothetical protein
VGAWAHYQERSSNNADYEYEAISFDSLQPVPLLWEILDRLEDRLRNC